MGNLQGPMAPAPTTGLASAGFLACTANSYYKYIFFAEPGQKVVRLPSFLGLGLNLGPSLTGFPPLQRLAV